ncbi:MAG: serine hydrolase domain-containing protein [Gemmatimonadaceae bacterium]
MATMTRSTPFIALLLLVCSTVLPAQRGKKTPAAADMSPPGWAEFTHYMDSSLAAGQVVGAGAVMVRDGRIVARHEFGLADRGRNERVTDRTLFHYGSITKTLTALSILQLRDRGKLSLDDKITRYVPELRQVHDPYGMIDSITIRMLLSHSAGFQNPTWPYTNGHPWEPFEPTTWNQLVAMMPYQELLFKPGSRFGYSNPGYIYLARVIEQLTGDPWETYVQKNIFAPLTLDRSYFGATPYYLAADRSNNYTIVRDSAASIEQVRENGRDFDPGITIPNGGWNAPLNDLVTYVAFLANASHGDSTLQRRYDTVMSRRTLEEMWQPVVSTGSRGTSTSGVGLGFFVMRDGATTIIGHTGSQAGFLSFLWLNPGTSTAIIAALNTDSDVPGKPSPFGGVNERALNLLRGTAIP